MNDPKFCVGDYVSYKPTSLFLEELFQEDKCLKNSFRGLVVSMNKVHPHRIFPEYTYLVLLQGKNPGTVRILEADLVQVDQDKEKKRLTGGTEVC
jgi:hypothetical protein